MVQFPAYAGGVAIALLPSTRARVMPKTNRMFLMIAPLSGSGPRSRTGTLAYETSVIPFH